MFGLSLPTLPFLGNGSDAKDDAPVVLTYEQVEEIGRELDALRDRTVASLGAEDREYIYKIIKAQRGFEVAGRGLMYLGFLPPVWLAAVGALSVSKILDNMEIGHNVMHGQYDWMREPGLNSEVFEWDTVCPADQWRHSHNYMHHTYTNILGKDRDIGYGILRIDDAQKWNPYYLGNPVWAFALMVLFEWGVMMHDLEIENVIQGKRKWHDVKPLLKLVEQGGQASPQGLRHLPGSHGAAVRDHSRGECHRQPGPERVDVLDHLLWPFPHRCPEFHRGRDGDETRGQCTCVRCSAAPTSREARSSTSCPATSRTRSSTTCSRTCLRIVIRNSLPR